MPFAAPLNGSVRRATSLITTVAMPTQAQSHLSLLDRDTQYDHRSVEFGIRGNRSPYFYELRQCLTHRAGHALYPIASTGPSPPPTKHPPPTLPPSPPGPPKWKWYPHARPFLPAPQTPQCRGAPSQP